MTEAAERETDGLMRYDLEKLVEAARMTSGISTSPRRSRKPASG